MSEIFQEVMSIRRWGCLVLRSYGWLSCDAIPIKGTLIISKVQHTTKRHLDIPRLLLTNLTSYNINLTTTPPQQVNNQCSYGDRRVGLCPPRKINGRTASSKWNSNKYYQFHCEYGHDTEEYIQLRNKIEALIQHGQLSQFVIERGDELSLKLSNSQG